MEALKETPTLKFNPNTKEEVRSLYDLNKPGRMEEAIRLLEQWIQKQEHFINKKFDTDCLERFIINNKGFTERAKSKLEKLCTYRTIIPEYFGYYDIREIQSVPHFDEIISYGSGTKLTPDNYRVYQIKISNTNKLTEEINLAYIRSSILCFEYVFKHDYAAGFIMIIDTRSMNLLDYMSKLNVTEIRKFTTVMQEGYGMRIKQIHYLSNSKVIDGLINVVKSVLPAKIAQRVYNHTSLESLHQMVPREVLCADYGGNEMPLDDLRDLWIDTLASQEHKDYMKMANQLRTDESKRIGDNISEQYLPGSFRTLSVD